MATHAHSFRLLGATIITSFCADYCEYFYIDLIGIIRHILVVASIEEVAERYHIPKTFIGIILLPIVANAAEHVTSVWMAMKNKTELTIGICVGSSIVREIPTLINFDMLTQLYQQIAAFVIPLLVIVGWM